MIDDRALPRSASKYSTASATDVKRSPFSTTTTTRRSVSSLDADITLHFLSQELPDT